MNISLESSGNGSAITFDNARKSRLLFEKINDEDKAPACDTRLNNMCHEQVEVIELVEVTDNIDASVRRRFL